MLSHWFLKIAGVSFLEYLSLSDMFHGQIWVVRPELEWPQSGAVFLSLLFRRQCTILTCPITHNVHFDLSVREVYLLVSRCKVALVNKYFVRRYFVTMSVTCSLKFFQIFIYT